MTELALKRRVGIFIVIAHALSLLLAISLFLAGGYSFDEFTTICAVVGPFFAGFVTQIVSFFVDQRFERADNSRPVTSEFVLLTFGFPFLITALVCLFLTLQAYGKVFDDFQQFKTAIVLVESLFAVYAARIITTLFHPKKKTS